MISFGPELVGRTEKTLVTERGLLSGGRLSSAGAAVLDQILARSAQQTAAIWTDLPEADVAATTRVLNTVLDRAEAVLTH